MKAHRRPVPGYGSQRMLHALERRSHSADHDPSFASLFPSLAAVSSAAIPVRVKLKIPRANAAAATTLDIPTGWDLQQRRPRPVADAGRSCWGSGQQDASAAQGTMWMLGAATRKQRRAFPMVIVPRGTFWVTSGSPAQSNRRIRRSIWSPGGGCRRTGAAPPAAQRQPGRTAQWR